MKKSTRMILIILSVIFVLIIFTIAFFNLSPQFGAKSTGIRLEKIQQSKNFNDKGKFVNLIPTDMDMSFSNSMKMMRAFMKSDPSRIPKDTIQTESFNHTFDSIDSKDFGMVWFGHSSILITIDGKKILTDPVFSERASMIPFMGPKRFDYSNQFNAEMLPQMDAVVISHDHYDHLDYNTILQLKEKVNMFFVPLGVGAHLIKWGIPENKITELDWWESASIDSLNLTCTPSRHFSGRGISNRDETLWCSWVIEGTTNKAFFGGDSGYFPGFEEIGNKFGPFDIAFLESGAYNKMWANIHMMPEETVQASIDLKSKVLMPIHWGKFNLALHPWKEPIQRVLKKAKETNVNVLTTIPGKYNSINNIEAMNWWDDYE
jgi:L-ascorbate metabolism protein UlaG (beta-lactamase superfamily)